MERFRPRNLRNAIAIAGLALSGCVSKQTETLVPRVEPTETTVSTATPTETPTDVPTPTETPTEVPTPTETPFVLPALDEWAAANGFQHVGTDKYYEKRASHGVAFWVEDNDEYQMRMVVVKIPNNAAKTVREEALNVWVKNLTELFMPAVAENVAKVTFVLGGRSARMGMYGYCFSYGARDMGRGDTAFDVTSQPCSWWEPGWGLLPGGSNAPCPPGDPDPSCP